MRPKTRQLIFTLMRVFPNPVVIDSYQSLESASDRMHAYEQELKDLGHTQFEFRVIPNCYYDE